MRLLVPTVSAAFVTERRVCLQADLAAITICFFVLVSCSRPATTPAASTERRPTLRAVILPDLSRMEAPVQQQLRGQYGSLENKIENHETPPGDLAAAYADMGKLLMAAEYLDGAHGCFLNAQILSPGDMRWPYYLGHIHRLRGEPAAAAIQFERALEIAPSDAAVLVWLGTVDLDLGKIDDAEPLFAKALSVQPRSVAAVVGQGRVALAQHRFARAAESFELALSIDSRASSVHYPLALAYRGLGESAKAELHLQQRGVVDVGPPDPLMQEIADALHSAVSYEKRGIRALDANDWATAATEFREALELKPDDGALHHRLGTALSLSGDDQQAASEFQRAIRLSPNYAPSHFSLGVLLARAGRDAEAADHFSAAVRREPAYADARLQLAAALIRLRRFDAAHAQLVEGAKYNPERAEFALALSQFQKR